MFYSGSSERFDFGEEADDKYALLVELEEGIKVKPVRLPIRKMITVIDFDCSGSSGSKIEKFILDSIELRGKELKNALVRIKLENVDMHENKAIDWEAITDKLEEYKVFDYKVQARTIVSVPTVASLDEQYILPPTKELELYIKSRRKYAKSADKLLKLGGNMIKRAEKK
jgi:DNA repair exonuclease SbcCD nuclease subunit